MVLVLVLVVLVLVLVVVMVGGSGIQPSITLAYLYEHYMHIIHSYTVL